MYYLGFDIGGSSIKAVAVKNKKIEYSKAIDKIPRRNIDYIKILSQLEKEFSVKFKNERMGGIGISIANPLDKKREKLVSRHKFLSLQGNNIKKDLAKEFKPCPVLIEHDSHCFLIAEREIGLAKKIKNVALFTLGSELGCAFMLDGKIVYGSHGAAGELMHNLWETPPQKRFIKGITDIINILDPEAVILSGGKVSKKDSLMPKIKKAIRKNVISSEAKKTRIIWSKLGRFGGALGAALLIQKSKIKNQNDKTKNI